ncbi:MAG: ribosome maturation factor RimM [Actinomycetota bacterium]|nr:ribosome maturation factor RimM [Actinomycetota bacterium]
MDSRLIGIIGKSHGVKGEVIIKLLTDYPNTIKKGMPLFLDESCTEKIEVENIKCLKSKGGKDLFLVKLRGINKRESAEELRGRHVFRSGTDTPALKKNQYWIDDIIGCRVFTADGTFIGTVLNVEKFISNDNLAVKLENDRLDIKGVKDKVFYIPVIKDYIEVIDLDDRKVVLKRIPEYI